MYLLMGGEWDRWGYRVIMDETAGTCGWRGNEIRWNMGHVWYQLSSFDV